MHIESFVRTSVNWMLFLELPINISIFVTFIHRPILSSPQLFVQSASVHPFPTQVTIVGFQLIFHTIQLEFASTKQMGFLGSTRGCARSNSVSQGELVGEGEGA